MTRNSIQPYPAICIGCGELNDFLKFLTNRGQGCPFCGRLTTISEITFFEYMSQFEGNLIHIISKEDIKQINIYLYGTDRLRHGWDPTLIEILSAIGLGIASNVSYDVIKYYLLSKYHSRRLNFNGHVDDYDRLISLLVNISRNNKDHIKKLKIFGNTIQFDFHPKEGRVHQKDRHDRH